MKNNNGDVTCSSGKKLKFHQKCAKSCPIRSAAWISLASSCAEQERCPDGEFFSKICLGESYTMENLNSIMTPQGFNGEKCEASLHSPDYVLEQSYLLLVHSGQKCFIQVACLWSEKPMFWSAGMIEGGKPLPLAFQHLILMI